MEMDVKQRGASVSADALDLTRELIRIPSINPPGDESACAKFLADLLNDLGFETRLSSFGEGRFNLLARIAGLGPGRPIGFTGHLDTVPLGTAPWSFDPFAAVEHEGKLYGRGASDMKAGIACFIEACLRSMDMLKAGPGVRLILTGGEETGCDGAKALIGEESGLLDDLALLIVGEPTANYPYIGHKGALWLRGTASGKTSHGSMPEYGDNAIYKGTRAVDKLRQFKLETVGHPLMGLPTLNVSTFHAGLNINSVPDRAEFEIDIRTVAGLSHKCVYSQLSELLEPDAEVKAIVDVPPLCSDASHPVIQSIFALGRDFLGQDIVPRTMSYFTDGSVLLDATGTPPTVILGPGEPQMAHQTDEYCRVDRIREGVDLYQALLEAQSSWE